jgi:hypothetical protein
MTNRFILDHDGGVDDYLALLLCLTFERASSSRRPTATSNPQSRQAERSSIWRGVPPYPSPRAR